MDGTAFDALVARQRSLDTSFEKIKT